LQIKDIFDSTKDALSINVPELGNIITHWEDPFTASINQTVILPDKNKVEENKLFFSIRLLISTVENNIDLIPYIQMDIVSKLTSIVCSNAIPFSAAGIECIYLDPVPQAPVTGVIDITIDLVIDYIDDCGI